MVLENISRAFGSPTGQALLAVGTGGLSLIPRAFEKRQKEEELKRQQQAQKQANLDRLERSLSGADTPEFLFNEAQTAAQQGNLRPLQALNRQRRGDITSALAAFDPKTAATSALAGLQQAPAQQKPQRPLTVSPGSSVFDPASGQFIGRAPGERAPLVQFGTEQTARQKKRGEAAGDFETRIDLAAEKAVGRQGNLNILEQQLSQVDTTGKTKPAQAFITNVAQSLGFALTDKAGKELTSQELIDSISKDLILEGAKRAGANPSNRDIKLLEDASAGLGKSLQGNLRWIDVKRAQAQTELDIQAIKDSLLDEPPRVLRKRIREFMKTNPVLRNFNRLQGERQQKDIIQAPQVDLKLKADVDALNTFVD